jgi:DNA-binding NarL/FixJ family response regulator
VRQTVLIVDDHAGFRSAARALLEEGGFAVVGEAADGATALAAARDLAPEIALVDVHLPDIDGFDVARQLAAAGSAVAVVLTSSRSIASLRWRLEANPGLPFIPKNDLSRAALAAALDGS